MIVPYCMLHHNHVGLEGTAVVLGCFKTRASAEKFPGGAMENPRPRNSTSKSPSTLKHIKGTMYGNPGGSGPLAPCC